MLQEFIIKRVGRSVLLCFPVSKFSYGGAVYEFGVCCILLLCLLVMVCLLIYVVLLCYCSLYLSFVFLLVVC